MISILGAVLMGPGILLAISSGEQDLAMVIVGSIGVLLGTVLFAIMFVGKAAMTKAPA